jgi:hypothetical protein
METMLSGVEHAGDGWPEKHAGGGFASTGVPEVTLSAPEKERRRATPVKPSVEHSMLTGGDAPIA